MSILKSRSHCSLVILTQTFFLGIENWGQGETDCLPNPAAAKQQARRITPYKNVTSCPKFKSRSLNYQCYFSLVLLNCTMAFALHTVTESSELQESCAFKIQGRSKNWSGPDPTDPTGSAGPVAAIYSQSIAMLLTCNCYWQYNSNIRTDHNSSIHFKVL